MKNDITSRLREIEEKDLKVRGISLFKESTELRMYAEEVYRRVEEFDKKYDLDSAEHELTWEVEEKMISEYDLLDRELLSVENRLIDLDERFNKLRKEVNKFYGREVLRDISGRGLNDFIGEWYDS
jgi:tetrahydromethanopterin S-methyltransferase subunit G